VHVGEKMGFSKTRVIQIFAKSGKIITVFILGGLAVHVLVMLLDYFVMIKPLYLNLHDNFMGSIFSAPMFPMMLAYGLLSLTIYFLWEKKKKALLLAREKEIQNEKVEAIVKSMQRLTGFLAEHIASQNTEIMNWIEFRKRKGRPVSEKIENPNRKIGKALQSLSEISFVTPYTESRPRNADEIENMLKDKLYDLTPRHRQRNEKSPFRSGLKTRSNP
jgi:hypothetical protein